MHPEVPGCGSTDGVFLLTEEASAVCAETRAGVEGGKPLDHSLLSVESSSSPFKYISCLCAGCVRPT